MCASLVQVTPVRAPARCPGRRRCTWWRARSGRRCAAAPRSRSAPGARPTCRADGRARWRRRWGSRAASSSARPSWRSTARPWAAKASFSSITSMSPIVRPRRLSSFSDAGAGPMPMIRGGTPATAAPRMRARGVRPLRLAASSRGDDQRGGAVVDARGIAGGDGAVLADDRLQLGQRFEAGLARMLVACRR